MKITDYCKCEKVPLVNGTPLKLIGYANLITYSKNRFPLSVAKVNTVTAFVNGICTLYKVHDNGTTDYLQAYYDRAYMYESDLIVALNTSLRVALDILPTSPHHVTAIAFQAFDIFGHELVLVYLSTTSLQGITAPYTTVCYKGSPYSIDTDTFNRVFIMQ